MRKGGGWFFFKSSNPNNGLRDRVYGNDEDVKPEYDDNPNYINERHADVGPDDRITLLRQDNLNNLSNKVLKSVKKYKNGKDNRKLSPIKEGGTKHKKRSRKHNHLKKRFGKTFRNVGR